MIWVVCHGPGRIDECLEKKEIGDHPVRDHTDQEVGFGTEAKTKDIET